MHLILPEINRMRTLAQCLFATIGTFGYSIGPMNTPYPKEIRRVGYQGLTVAWSDGRISTLNSKSLRAQCPCATCREKRGDASHATPLTPPKPSALRIVSSSIDEEERLEEVWSVGGYAIGIRWGDGHATGIYTFPYLKQLEELAADHP